MVAKQNFVDSSPPENNLLLSAAKIKKNMRAREWSKLHRCCFLVSNLVDALFVLACSRPAVKYKKLKIKKAFRRLEQRSL